ncbi:MAG: Ldh family oxidoreductase [Pseudomonadota bacterium]
MTHVTLTETEGRAFITRALMAANVSEANAATVARALVAAEVEGQSGHGFSRVPAYAAQARAGKVKGHAEPVVTQPATGALLVDAAHGFAYPAINAAIAALPGIVAESGIAAAAITRSHHCGQLSAHVERLAEAGCLALMVANAPKAMAPWGGNAPLFGTNPIAFAVPRRGEPPLVVDLSLSKVARGKVMLAAKRGQDIPEGWAIDVDGKPTTDAEAALKGSMIPAGDAKGAALAMMVEIMAVSLTGAQYSYEASSFFDDKGDPPGVGQYIIAIRPETTAGAAFHDRIEALIAEILAQPGTRLPGQKRLTGRAAAAERGVTIPKALHDEIAALAG